MKKNKHLSKFRENGGNYVKFRGLGGFQEKLIGKLMEENIPLYEISESNSELYGLIKARHYEYVKRTAKKYGIRLKIIEKKGIYFRLYKYRKRWGLVIGALCCCAVIVILSQFVWDVRIIGNKAVSENEICRVLQQCGLMPGASTKSFSVNSCEYKALAEISELSWISVEREGSRVFVKISEYEDITQQEIPSESPCNIISDYDGQLISAIVKRGTLKTEVGSGIYKGQVLVSGAVDNNMGGMIYIHAEAELTARCTEIEEFYIPFTQEITIPTETINYSSYFLLGSYALPIFWEQYTPNSDDVFTYSEETSYINFFGINTPFKSRKGIYTQLETKTVTYKNEDIIKQLEKQKKLYEENFLSGFEIVSCDKEIIPQADGISMRLTYTVDRKIGEKQQISILY